MWSNAEAMLHRAGRLPIRVATKSVRCRALLSRIASHNARFRGFMTFTLAETIWLAEHGATDLLLAYPTTDVAALRRLGDLDRASAPVLMVDCVEHLDLIVSATGSPSYPVRVCIDLDMGYQRAWGRLAFGPKRSPVRTPEQARRLATEVLRRPELDLAGVMGYEGHIAGVGDRPLGRPLRGLGIAAAQRRWTIDVSERRRAMVEAVRQVAPLRIVNGGGTGSLHLTSRESALTEVAAGSGFFAPTLFDSYRAFRLRPAAMFVLPVVRRPSDAVATVLGGGYLASGAATADRLPQPYLPTGLRLDGLEGAGEVQTPLRGKAARGLHIGDHVYFRHAKAGELCERFNTLLLLQGGRIVDEVPTYRGEGMAFL